MEVWKSVPGYEEYYEVSSLGNVRSLDRVCLKKDGKIEKRMGRILKPALRAGYPFINLAVDGNHKQVHVHRLVAQSFCAKSDGCNVVNHLDGDKCNNNYLNLEWTTHQGNMRHALDNGLKVAPKGEDAAHAKLTVAQVNEIRRRFMLGATGSDLSKEFGVNNMSISCIRSAKNWRDAPGIDVDLMKACSKLPIYRKKGSANPKSKLNETIVEGCIKLLKAGVRSKDIQEKLGMSQPQVSGVNVGLLWSHVIVKECGYPPYSPHGFKKKKKLRS